MMQSHQPSVQEESESDESAAHLSPYRGGGGGGEGYSHEAQPRTKLSSFAGIVGTFVEHLECAIHTILYERDIYPRELFMATRKYSSPVKMCRVPKVSRFVRDVVENVGDQLLEGGVQVVSVVILSAMRQPLERFNFDVGSFPVVERGRVHSLMLHEGEEAMVGMPSLAELHEQFRALMQQLSVCSAKLGRLPENCTFTVAVEMEEGAGPPKDHTRNWVVSESQKSGKTSNSVVGLASGGVRSIPLRSVEAGALNMDVWVEESNVKVKLPV